MSTAPSAKPLFQYIPGIGKIPVVQCAPCPTGPTGPTGRTGPTGTTGPQGFSSGSVYFLNYKIDPEAPTPAGDYWEMSKVPGPTVYTLPVSSDGNFASFLTPVGDPGQAEIPAGAWTFHFHVASVTGDGPPGPNVYGEVYVWDGVNAPVLVGDNAAAPIVLNVVNYNQWYDFVVGFAAPVPLNPTDRILVKLYATNTAGFTANFEYGDNLLAQVTTTLAQGFGPTGPTGPTGPQGVTGSQGPTGGAGVTNIVATAFSTADQTITVGTASLIQHDTVPFSYGITTTTGPSGSFTVPDTGIYKIIPSVQILGANNGKALIWLKVNGSNVPDTTTLTAFKQNDEGVITTEYLLSLSANDYIQVYATALSNNYSINYVPAGGVGANAYPAAPGIITDIFRIR